MIHILSEIVKQKIWKNYEEWIMDTRENKNSELGLGFKNDIIYIIYRLYDMDYIALWVDYLSNFRCKSCYFQIFQNEFRIRF